MRTAALVLVGVVAATTAQAQGNMYAPMAMYATQAQQMAPMFNMQSPTRSFFTQKDLPMMMQSDNQSMSNLMSPDSRPEPVKVEDASERMADVPTVSPQPGSYQGTTMVTITTNVPGATIYYSLDGKLPHWGSPQYTGPIKVSHSAHLMTFVVPPHGLRSPTVDVQYEIH